jgi:DNA-binding XRE family transcriptional regulator
LGGGLNARGRPLLSQDRMAKRIDPDCSAASYQNWERGVSEPDVKTFTKIVRLCPDAEMKQAFLDIGLDNSARAIDNPVAVKPRTKEPTKSNEDGKPKPTQFYESQQSRVRRKHHGKP